MAKKKKAKRRYTRKKKSRSKRRAKGWMDKVGSILIGVVPIGASSVEAVAWATHPIRKDMPIMDKVTVGVVRWANNLTAGLFGKNILHRVATPNYTEGYPIGNAWEKGSEDGTQATPWLWTIAGGLAFKIADRVAGMLAGSGSKLAGMTVTGGK